MNAKIYPISLILMILINAALIFTLINQKPRGERPERREPSLKNHISEKLNLSETQKKEYFELAQSHGAALEKLTQDEEKLIHTYFNFLNDEEPIMEDQKLILDQLKTLETRKIQMTYRHFEKLKTLCTEDQLTHFEAITNDIISVLVAKGEKRPPRPRD